MNRFQNRFVKDAVTVKKVAVPQIVPKPVAESRVTNDELRGKGEVGGFDREIQVRTLILAAVSGYGSAEKIKAGWGGFGAVVGLIVALLYDVMAFGHKIDSAGQKGL